jgi:hypothetical protein
MEELAQFLVRLLKWTIASVIIGGLTLLAVVVTNWNNTPAHGWHLVKDTAAPEKTVTECNCTNAPPPHPRHVRRHVVQPIEEPAPVEVEQQPDTTPDREQTAPVQATNADLQSWLPRYEAAPVIQYNVIVIEPRKHGRVRRFFGAIGHGFIKVVRFGN